MGFQILIVDDEENSRRALAQFLAEDGYEVVSCSDGEQAIEILQKSEVDLLITDLKMPKLDGIGLLEYVRDHRPAMHTLVITAYGETESYLESMNRGARDYLNKPVDCQELLRILKTLASS